MNSRMLGEIVVKAVGVLFLANLVAATPATILLAFARTDDPLNAFALLVSLVVGIACAAALILWGGIVARWIFPGTELKLGITDQSYNESALLWLVS